MEKDTILKKVKKLFVYQRLFNNYKKYDNFIILARIFLIDYSRTACCRQYS